MKNIFLLHRRFGGANRRRLAVVQCAVALLVMALILVCSACISNQALAVDFSRTGLPPSWQYPFGTDWLGRNLLPRTIKGLALSLQIGLAATACSVVVASVIGMCAALGSPKIDAALSWLIDLFMSVPHLVLMILIAFACGRGTAGLLIGIVATHWTSLARVVRAELMQIRSQPYVMVSRRLGHGSLWVMRNHFLPHLLPQLLVGGVLMFPHAILHEAALSFLGYGLPPEQPAIGIMLSESISYFSAGMWWPAIIPGVLLVLLVLLFDMLGESVRALTSPHTAQQ